MRVRACACVCVRAACVRACVCACVCVCVWCVWTHGQQLRRQVVPVVDAAVHDEEAPQVRLVLHAGVVEAGVQHDDGEG